jgi:dTDP-4-dehydrorhamnose 3,5-epimerase
MKRLEIEKFLHDGNEGEIEGLLVIPKKIIEDERGCVMHALRSDSPEFKGFGETYVSTVKCGIWKEWKRHKLMVQSFVVPVGTVEFLLKDERMHSSTKGHWKRLFAGRGDYKLIQIPSMVWYCFHGIEMGESLIVNTASIPHDPIETERL